MRFGDSLAIKHMALIAIEFLTICKFIQEQNYESDEDLFDFLEDCFIEMVCFTLYGLPLTILNEISGNDPSEIGEGRVREAWKFFCKLELLWDTIEWSWPVSFDPKNQANDVHSPAIASVYSISEVEAEASNVIHGNVGNNDSSSIVATAVVATVAVATVSNTDYDNDTIVEIESNEII
ncbi:hypothetical protein NE237_009434 [Protea cynaroides]|uniref:Uncharacterized protein n=1 Tax=Protea cynaroides TaxID=273540 RepID=A0A9Q0KYJ7_9MAGN|nr:hypothetical protein NE237_009434 [Protea cynaroides]